MNKPQNTRGRQRLIDATLKSIGQRGYHGSSLRSIAEIAGLSAGLVKHHFDGKEEMMLEAFRYFRNNRLDAFLDDANKAGADPVERLEAMVRWIFLFDSSRRETFRIWAGFVELIITDERAMAIHVASREKFTREIRGCVTGIYAARGEKLPPADAQQVAMAIAAVIGGAWIESCLSPSLLTPEEALEISLDTIGVRIGATFKTGAGDRS